MRNVPALQLVNANKKPGFVSAAISVERRHAGAKFGRVCIEGGIESGRAGSGLAAWTAALGFSAGHHRLSDAEREPFPNVQRARQSIIMLLL